MNVTPNTVGPVSTMTFTTPDTIIAFAKADVISIRTSKRAKPAAPKMSKAAQLQELIRQNNTDLNKLLAGGQL